MSCQIQARQIDTAPHFDRLSLSNRNFAPAWIATGMRRSFWTSGWYEDQRARKESTVLQMLPSKTKTLKSFDKKLGQRGIFLLLHYYYNNTTKQQKSRELIGRERGKKR